jgi:galactose-1-phosphate uridylyltransferase
MQVPYDTAAATAFLTTLRDGTVKQINPFTGTEVWTVPGRGNRPLGTTIAHPDPIDPAAFGTYCAFCEKRYLETPPEKARVVRGPEGDWHTVYRTPAEHLFATTAEFRRIPNLFEILSYEYWHLNYGYEVTPDIAERRRAYLAADEGLAHVLAVARGKMRAGGMAADEVAAASNDEVLQHAAAFFGGGHDVILARRHFVDGATNTAQLASSGSMTPEEHCQYFTFTVESARRLYEINRYVRYVAVFQNWLKPAGASFDHLHKQLVSIDERGVQNDRAIHRLRQNPNVFNEAGVNYASYHNLLLAENDHAVAFAGFGHRYPTIEIYSKSEHSWPWDHSLEEIGGMSDLVHAMHAATGADVPSNEEWHHRPVDADVAMPWRVMLKWRISTVAGFEGGTKIYVNTIDPQTMRDRLVPRLFELRAQGRIGGMRIAMECSGKSNLLRYNPVR